MYAYIFYTELTCDYTAGGDGECNDGRKCVMKKRGELGICAKKTCTDWSDCTVLEPEKNRKCNAGVCEYSQKIGGRSAVRKN